MIVQITGKLIEKKEQSLIIDVNGLCYEVIVPASVFQRVDETEDSRWNIVSPDYISLFSDFTIKWYTAAYWIY